MDEEVMQELNDFESKRPKRRSRRAARAASANAEAEASEAVEATAKPVDPREKELEETFGPVDDKMKLISDARLVGVDIAEKMVQGITFGDEISDEELEAAGKWLILSFEHKSELAAPDDPNAIETLTVSLNSCDLENPDEQDSDKRKYKFNPKKKEVNDKLIDYAFGEKYGFHTMEELYSGIDDVLDQTGEDQSIPLPIYSSTFQGKNGAYIVVYKLINRHKSGGYVQTEKFTEDEYIAAVTAHGKLPVKIHHIEDINNKLVETKDGKRYRFAQISVICQYNGKFYDVKYPYLHNQKDGHWIQDVDKTYPDYSKKSKQIMELASQFGLDVQTKSRPELLDEIVAIKDRDAFITVKEAPSSKNDDKRYYARINNR